MSETPQTTRYLVAKRIALSPLGAEFITESDGLWLLPHQSIREFIAYVWDEQSNAIQHFTDSENNPCAMWIPVKLMQELATYYRGGG